MEEYQICPSMGTHPQDLRPTGDRRQAGRHTSARAMCRRSRSPSGPARPRPPSGYKGGTRAHENIPDYAAAHGLPGPDRL